MLSTILKLLKKSAELQRRRKQKKQINLRTQKWFWGRWHWYRHSPRWGWLLRRHRRKLKKRRKHLFKRGRLILKRRFFRFCAFYYKLNKRRRRPAVGALKRKIIVSGFGIFSKFYFKFNRYFFARQGGFCLTRRNFALFLNWRNVARWNRYLFLRYLGPKIWYQSGTKQWSSSRRILIKPAKRYSRMGRTEPQYIYFSRQNHYFNRHLLFIWLHTVFQGRQNVTRHSGGHSYNKYKLDSGSVKTWFLVETGRKYFVFNSITFKQRYKYMRKLWRLALKIKFERFFFTQLHRPVYIWFYNVWGLFFKHQRRWRRFEKKIYRRLIKQRARKLTFLSGVAKIFLRTLGLLCFISGSFYCFLHVLTLLFRKHRGHWQLTGIIRRYIRVIRRRFGTIRCCRIVINGKFNGAMRARKQTIVVGSKNAKFFLVNARTSYSYAEGFTKWGIFGIHIWLQLRENKPSAGTRFSWICKKQMYSVSRRLSNDARVSGSG